MPTADGGQGLDPDIAETATDLSLGASPSPERPMWLNRVNARVDHALADNHRGERVLVRMAVVRFSFGLLVLFLAYWIKNPYLGAAAVVIESFVIRAFKEIRRLRKNRLILQTFPALIDGLPEDAAADEIKTLLAFLRDEK